MQGTNRQRVSMAVTVWTRFRGMLDLNLGRTPLFWISLSWFSLVSPGKCLDIISGHYRFFPNPFQFIHHLFDRRPLTQAID
jgi:hypothetical protein